MMKSTMGSLGLYCEGLEPSMTPPCEGARSAAAEALASAAADVTLERTEDVVAILSGWGRGLTCVGEPGLAHHAQCGEEERECAGMKGNGAEVIMWVPWGWRWLGGTCAGWCCGARASLDLVGDRCGEASGRHVKWRMRMA